MNEREANQMLSVYASYIRAGNAKEAGELATKIVRLLAAAGMSTEGGEAKSGILAEGFDGSTVRPGPNHSTIEIWYDTEAQARAAHSVILDLIDAASPKAGESRTETDGVMEAPDGK